MEKSTFNKSGDLFYVICRISIGLFFLITGFNKLFHPVFQGYMLKTITGLGFSNPQFMAHFVAFNEAFWGLLLLLGLLTRFSSLSLIVIMLVALITKDLHSIPTELVPVDPKVGIRPMDNFTWLTYFFFLPQVLFMMLLGMFSLYGYKAFGIDQWIGKKKKVSFICKKRLTVKSRSALFFFYCFYSKISQKKFRDFTEVLPFQFPLFLSKLIYIWRDKSSSYKYFLFLPVDLIKNFSGTIYVKYFSAADTRICILCIICI